MKLSKHTNALLGVNQLPIKEEIKEDLKPSSADYEEIREEGRRSVQCIAEDTADIQSRLCYELLWHELGVYNMNSVYIYRLGVINFD